MGERDIIRRRVIDQAVALFNMDNPGSEGSFTTAHYGQAMKTEFKMLGPILDGATCVGHLSQIGDIVERVEGNLWRCKAWPQQESPVQSDMSESAASAVEASAIDDAERLGSVLRILNGSAAEREDLVQSDLTETTQTEIDAVIDAHILQILDVASTKEAPCVIAGTAWWPLEAIADVMAIGDKADPTLENLVGRMLYTMAVDGRVVVQRNVLLGDEHRTVFSLTPKSADVD